MFRFEFFLEAFDLARLSVHTETPISFATCAAVSQVSLISSLYEPQLRLAPQVHEDACILPPLLVVKVNPALDAKPKHNRKNAASKD